MSAPVRFLFTSVGRRVELLRHFLDWASEHPGELEVLGTEIDPGAPAAQLLGERIKIVPRVDDPTYASTIAALCRDEGVDAVFPLIDPDVEALAGHPDIPLASVDSVSAAMVSDKWLTAGWLAGHEIPSPRTWLPESTGDGDLPAFMKPRRGSAGVDAFAVRTRREHDFFADYIESPVVQELLPGDEVTIDVVVGRNGEVLATAQRRRLAVRGGEVSRAVIIDDPEITGLVERVTSALRPLGPVTVQGMYAADNTFRITEINARMGGGLPLAIAGGVPLAELLTHSWAGRTPDRVDARDIGLHMVRFDDSFFHRS